MNFLTVFFSLFFINLLLYQSNIIQSTQYFLILSICFLLKLFYMKYTKLELMFLYFFSLFSIVSKNPKLLLLFATMLYLKEINPKKITRMSEIFFLLGILSFFSIIFLAIFGFIDPKLFVYSSIKLRNGLGFKNPNTPGIYYFILISHYYFFKWNTLKTRDNIVILSGYILLYIFTLSRTNVLVGIFQVLLIYFLKGRVSRKKIKNYYLIPFCGYFLSVLMLLFQTDFLNNLMSSRPLTWKLNFGEKINCHNILFGNFGEKIKYPLDNGFLSIQFYYGIIAIMIILFFLCCGLKKMEEEYRERIYLLFICYVLYALSEDMLLSVNFGILIPFIMSRTITSQKYCKNKNIMINMKNRV